MSFDEFQTAYYRRLPCSSPCTALDTAALLDWETLARVLAAEPPADALVVAHGERLDVPAPRTLTELRALLSIGAGLCVRGVEHCDRSLADVARELEELFGPAHVQLFVTAPGTQGLSWHYDDDDMFIVQALGTKEYLFRANTVAPDRRFPEERSPICAATLAPGDFLYIPARWWHMAEASVGDPSLSISVGVRPRSAGASDTRTTARART